MHTEPDEKEMDQYLGRYNTNTKKVIVERYFMPRQPVVLK